MRTIHRGITLFVVLVTIYLSVTGTLIQVIDLRTILTQAPADDPDMEAMREATYGPGAFQVIANPDYTADALPGDLNLESSLNAVLGNVDSSHGNAMVSTVRIVEELQRMKNKLRFTILCSSNVCARANNDPTSVQDEIT